MPPNIKTIRVVARLCYGNQTKSREVTRLMSFVRNMYQETSSQIHFDQRLIFNNANLCALQRESLLLFEVYATFIDESDSSLSSLVCEIFDGISMRLIGWCSQAVFDDEHHLISGEHYLGVMDASKTSPTGFYSLRNVLDRDCLILTVSFAHDSFYWPNIQARKDLCPRSFTEISQKKQAFLSQLLERPSLLLADYSTILVNDTYTENRKQQLSNSPSDKSKFNQIQD